MAGSCFESSKKKILLNIVEAQDHDGKEHFFEAYKMYLICLKSMADLLIISCHSYGFQITDQDLQYISLCNLCCERLKVLAQKIKPKTSSSNLFGQNVVEVGNTYGIDTGSPLDEANKYNQMLIASHQNKLKVYSEINKHLFLNLNLSLQRKMVENIKIAEKHKLALDRKKAQKQKQILEETEMRFKTTKINQEDETIRRKIYFDVLQFESNHLWLRDIRNNEKSIFLDSKFVTNLIEKILKIAKHPYTQYLQREQIKICFEVKQFCDESDKQSIGTEHEDSLRKEASLTVVTDNVKKYFKNVCNVFILIYENLDNKNGFLLVESILDEYFFKGVWDSLKDLFRSSTEDTIIRISSVFQHYNNCPTFHSSEVGVREKFQLLLGETDDGVKDTEGQAYGTAINCLLSILRTNSLHSKVQGLVTFMHEICNCIEKYYANKQEEPPEIGADDLLPVLTYLLIRTNEPSIYIHCYILMEFVDESILLGEEGYSLTSILTAFDWISKMDNGPNNNDNVEIKFQN